MRKIVERIDAIKGACGPGGFVALQVTDEMRGNFAGNVRQLAALPFPLLHAIFSKLPETCEISFPNRLDGMVFGDADQGDFVGITRRTRGRAGNAFMDAEKIFGDRGHGSIQFSELNRNTGKKIASGQAALLTKSV